MNYKTIPFAILLFTSIYLLSGCNNESGTTPAPPADTAKTDDHKQHSMEMMQGMDAMMQRMNASKMTGDFDVDFANMMIEHHQGAINMSEMELKQGADAQMKDMAQKIITAQIAEIAKMRAFVQAHPVTATQQPMTMGNIQMMHNQMKAMPMTGNVDKDFAVMMKIHHQGAVDMAREALNKGHHTDIKNMAQQMIADQQREIIEFDAWLAKNK